jgi:anti-sigma B factor antagonist
MTLKEDMKDGIAILKCKGNLVSDGDTSKIKDKIHSLVQDEVKRVVIDLGDVNFINSSGLGSLISVHTTLQKAGGELKLARIGEKVENLFIITQLVKVFDTYETLDRALASFGKKK